MVEAIIVTIASHIVSILLYIACIDLLHYLMQPLVVRWSDHLCLALLLTGMEVRLPESQMMNSQRSSGAQSFSTLFLFSALRRKTMKSGPKW